MSDRCEEMRQRIASLTGRENDADERAAIDLHCAECESCREYREELLADHRRLDAFAAAHLASEKRAEERCVEMLPATVSERARRPRILGGFARIPVALRIAAAATVVILILVGIDFLQGARNGAVPAFASVVEKMEQVENVVYRHRALTLGRWVTTERAKSREGFSRVAYEDSIRIWYDHDSYAALRLYPAEKRALLDKRTSSPYRRRDRSVERIATHHKREGFAFVRRDRYEGKDAAIYESRGKTNKAYRWVTWVDLETDLPLRIEIFRSQITSPGGLHLYGLAVEDFLPSGAARSAADGWIDLDPDEPDVISDNFRWNAEVDSSYFSMAPPPGYRVSEFNSFLEFGEPVDERHLRCPYAAIVLTRALSLWLSLSNGVFPEDIHDLGDSSVVRRILIAKHDKNGKAGDEFRAAMVDAELIQAGHMSVKAYDDNLHYLGAGAVFGDSTRVVCWGEGPAWEGAYCGDPYWMIYADLRLAAAKKPPEILDH